MHKRIVVTGLGFLSVLGNNEKDFLEKFSSNEPKSNKIADFDPINILGAGSIRSLDRNSLLSLCSAKKALDNSEINLSEFDLSSIGVSLGTMGSPYSGYDFYKVKILENPRYVNPMQFPNTVVNVCASQIAIRFGFTGLNATVSTGVCAGMDAIIYAANMLSRGHAKLMLAGGTEESFREVNNAFNFSGKNEISEGAAVLVLECLEDALRRNALILAEVKGYSQKLDAVNDAKSEKIQEVINEAAAASLLKKDAIDCVLSYGKHNVLEDYSKAKHYILSDIIGNGYGLTGALGSIAATLLIKNDIHKNVAILVNSCYGHYSGLVLGKFNG